MDGNSQKILTKSLYEAFNGYYKISDTKISFLEHNRKRGKHSYNGMEKKRNWAIDSDCWMV
jgi:hypothetical protein